MSLELPTLLQKVSLHLNTEGLHHGASEAERDGGRIKGSLEKIGKAAAIAGVAFAGFGAAEFLKSAIEGAREEARSMRLIEAALKSTGNAAHTSGKQIEENASKLSVLDGVTKSSIIATDQLLLKFTNISNQAGKNNDIYNQTTQAILNVAAATGKGMVPVTTALGKALNDPVKGLAGLARVGIQFSKGQKDQIKQLVEHNHLLAAQHVILGALNTRFAGAAAAAADPVQRLSALLKNLEEQVGKALLPALNAGVNFIINTVVPAISKFSSVLHAGFSGKGLDAGGIIGVIAKVGAAVKGIIAFFTGNTFVAGGFFGKILGLNPKDTASLIKTLTNVRATIVRVVGDITTFVKDHFKQIAIGAAILLTPFIILIPAALYFLYTRFKIVRTIVADFVAGVKVVAQVFTRDVLPVITQVATYLGKQFAAAVQFVAALWPSISEAAGHVFTVLKVLFAVGIAPLLLAWKLFHNQIMAVLRAAWKFIQSFVRAALQVVRGVIKLVLDLINGDWGKAWNDIKLIVSGVWDAIYAYIRLALSLVKNAISAALSFVKAIWSGAWNALVGIVSGVWNGIIGSVAWGVRHVLGYFSGIKDRIISALGDVASWLLDVGKKVMDGLLNGFKAGWHTVGGWLSSLNPAKLFNDINVELGHAGKNLHPMGVLVMQGLQMGMQEGWKGVSRYLASRNPADHIVSLDAARTARRNVVVQPTGPASGAAPAGGHVDQHQEFTFNVQTASFDEASLRRMERQALMLARRPA